MEALSHRYGVTTAEILKANGYKGPRALQPGQQLIIPPRAVAAAPVAARAEGRRGRCAGQRSRRACMSSIAATR